MGKWWSGGWWSYGWQFALGGGIPLWNAAKPAGSEKIRDGDDSIRANNQALEDALNREHIFPGTPGSTAGLHKTPVVSSNPDGYEGRLAIVNDVLQFYSNSAWHISSFPAGTKLPFYQATAPLGWTQDTSVNDKLIRIVSGTGGGSGGNWTLSGATIDDHVLTIDEIPSHTHPVYYATFGNLGSSMTAPYTSGSSNNSGATGGGLGHGHGLTHDGNWRPAYIDFIIATKN